jgi:tetratricopeptide (TPR) repeat protein
MKRLLFILTLASSTALDAAPASPAPRPVQDFSNLTQDKRNEFAEIYQEASRLFQQKRIFETLEKLDAAERIFPDSAALLNLRGVALIEFRSFDKATAAFTRALEINPEMPGVKFNLAEIAFVTHDWKAAAERFEALIPQLSKDDTGLLRLIEYKILLSKLKLGQVDDARKLATKYDFLDDSPFYYYAQASLAYHDGKPEDAQQWLGRATRIFRTSALLSPWQDTLMEYNRKPGGDDAPVLGIPVPEAAPTTEE